MYIVSTPSQFLQVQRNISDLQVRLVQAQEQVTTGKKGRQFAALGPDVARSVSLRAESDRLEAYRNNIAVVGPRIDGAIESIEQINDVALSVRDELIRSTTYAADENSGTTRLNTLARQAFDEVVSALNTRADNRYVFSGQEIDTEPVQGLQDIEAEITTLYGPNPTDADLTEYFETNAAYSLLANAVGQDDLSVRVDEARDLSYALGADNPSAGRVLKGLYIAATTGYDPATYDQTVQNAISALETGLNGDDTVAGLNNEQARLGVVRSTLHDISARHQEELLLLEEQIGEVEDVDVAEAITRFETLTSQIEAAFTVTSRVYNLSLTNFL